MWRRRLSAVLLWAGATDVAAQEQVTALAPVKVSTTTGEKPQSKLWFHAGRWWAVLPSTSVRPAGTWLWRLGADNRWTNVLRLTSSTKTKADAKAVGDVTHVLLHGARPQLVSVEYDATRDAYVLWAARPTPTPIALPGSETATIDVDSTGRMWLATESGSRVDVLYGDPPYTGFAGPVVLADDIAADDITAVTALPDATVGVLWSNQNTQRFGFRVHADGVDPTAWLPDEVPASQSALHVGHGMADDHLHLAVGSDATLYAAVKSSYDTSGFPQVALLVRRPTGQWDHLYEVDEGGTRGIVLLNEPAGIVRVVYTTASGGGNIVFRDSPLVPIAFGARQPLIAGNLNNATSTKMRWTDQLVVLASGRGVRITHPLGAATTTITTSTTTTTTSTTLPGPGPAPAPATASVEADVSVVAGSATAFGGSATLQVDGSPVKHAFLRIAVSGTAARPVTQAVLRLQVAIVAGAASDSKGRLHRSTCGWTESTLTGTIQPQPTIDAAVLDAPPGSAVAGQVVDFDVTGAITAGDGAYCVALDTTSSNGVQYDSREAAGGRPTVILTVAP